MFISFLVSSWFFGQTVGVEFPHQWFHSRYKPSYPKSTFQKTIYDYPLKIDAEISTDRPEFSPPSLKKLGSGIKHFFTQFWIVEKLFLNIVCDFFFSKPGWIGGELPYGKKKRSLKNGKYNRTNEFHIFPRDGCQKNGGLSQANFGNFFRHRRTPPIQTLIFCSQRQSEIWCSICFVFYSLPVMGCWKTFKKMKT